MPQVTVTVPGRPIPWARARQSRSGGHFTAPRQAAYAALVRDTGLVAMRTAAREIAPTGTAVTFNVWWYLPWPKGTRKANRDTSAPMVGTPDVDNCLKMALDSLTGIVFEDDAQVSDTRVTKRYCPRGEERLVIEAIWDSQAEEGT